MVSLFMANNRIKCMKRNHSMDKNSDKKNPLSLTIICLMQEGLIMITLMNRSIQFLNNNVATMSGSC